MYTNLKVYKISGNQSSHVQKNPHNLTYIERYSSALIVLGVISDQTYQEVVHLRPYTMCCAPIPEHVCLEMEWVDL